MLDVHKRDVLVLQNRRRGALVFPLHDERHELLDDRHLHIVAVVS